LSLRTGKAFADDAECWIKGLVSVYAILSNEALYILFASSAVFIPPNNSPRIIGVYKSVPSIIYVGFFLVNGASTLRACESYIGS
jgi:hypothetical protein